jgi:uncharacterized protein YjiS (DUF1127 family)
MGRSGALADARMAVSAWITGFAERGRQRRALADLDDRLLRDVGLTCADAERECAKGVWLR